MAKNNDSVRPAFVPLDISLAVTVDARHNVTDVRDQLLKIFSGYPRIDGKQGFFHPGRFTPGQPVYGSTILDAAMQVPGVETVAFLRFCRMANSSENGSVPGTICVGPNEIVQLDNDPDNIENGRFEVMISRALVRQ